MSVQRSDASSCKDTKSSQILPEGLQDLLNPEGLDVMQEGEKAEEESQ